MKQVWMEAQASKRLPPPDTIPTPEYPVTSRQKVLVQTAPSKPVRPVIPERAVIAVEPFSERPIARYEGKFEVIAQGPGLLRGKLTDQQSMLEIFYKIPEGGKLVGTEKSAPLRLHYRDEVIGNALQRRVVLLDTETKRAPLISIAEGSLKPYRTVIEELGLMIEQTIDREIPAVRVVYGRDSVTLHEGEMKKVGSGAHQLTVYLINSYVRDERYADVDEGQPYYVNIVLYQLAE
jgi:hypothetical protein